MNKKLDHINANWKLLALLCYKFFNFYQYSIISSVLARLLQRLKLAHFGRRNCYQYLSDVTGMPDISHSFILLYDCNNFIWSFRFFECIQIWIIFKKYAVNQNNIAGTICAIPDCKSRHRKYENFEVFLNSPKIFWNISQKFPKGLLLRILP